MINSIKYFEETCIPFFEKMEDDFIRHPGNFAEYVYGITSLLHKLGLEILRESMETMNQMLCDSFLRRRNWIVEAHHSKTLTTSLGNITFKRTLFQNKETHSRTYLLDQIMGLKPGQRLTEDAIARILEEAVQTSYEKGARQASLTAQVSRQTVKNKIHSLDFPPNPSASVNRKQADYLYIDADEDHVALQFREKKGDLVKAENGAKNNGLLTKIVYVYEGKENETLHGKRKVLKNCHYFCGVKNEKENQKFWDDISRYLEQNYDLEHVKKIYLNADGGSWIKAGMKRLSGVTYVLDGFHLEKCLSKLVSFLPKKEQADALEKLRETIRNKTKADFQEEVNRQKEKLPKWRNPIRVEEAEAYLLSNWMAAKVRLRRKDGVVGSSTESHVSHILSARMSSRPMGWSRKGAGKMAELRAYALNGGEMLTLVRYQNRKQEKEEEEAPVLSSTEIVRSEKNRHRELGKYVESITHSLSIQTQKKVYFQSHIRNL